jgi:hypothetical protein
MVKVAKKRDSKKGRGNKRDGEKGRGNKRDAEKGRVKKGCKHETHESRTNQIKNTNFSFSYC